MRGDGGFEFPCKDTEVLLTPEIADEQLSLGQRNIHKLHGYGLLLFAEIKEAHRHGAILERLCVNHRSPSLRICTA